MRSYEVPAPRALVWAHLTDPQLRARWTPGVQRVDQTTPEGRRGTGTKNHCVHGRNASVEEILDWRPFDYFTIDNHVPVPLLKPFRTTYELEDTSDGTRVTEITQPARGFGQRLVLRVAALAMVGQLARGQEALREAVAATQATPQ